MSRGFSVVEVLIALALISSALVGLAYVSAVGVSQTRNTRDGTMALTLAQSKLEELRGLAWAYDTNGARISSPGLDVSPPESLFEDHSGYADSIDAFGEPARSDEVGVVAYRRRWAVSRFDPADEDTLTLRICVFSLSDHTNGRIHPPEACVSTIRTRKP